MQTIHTASHLLYAVLYGEMPNAFYKLSVHSGRVLSFECREDIICLMSCMCIALSPGDIKVFFEPIIKWGVEILENFRHASDVFNQYRHPVITVSVLLIVTITKTVCTILYSTCIRTYLINFILSEGFS